MKQYLSSEFEEQAAFVEYCERLRIPVFAIPNGYYKTPASRVKAQSEGLKAGVPDLFIPLPTKKHHGLFIEMKYGRGQVSDKQQAWIDLLTAKGYAAVVCYSSEKAIAAFKDIGRNKCLKVELGQPQKSSSSPKTVEKCHRSQCLHT